jgi:hypothetical protein
MKKLLLLVCLTIISIAAIGQTGEVRGVVTDKKTGEPMIFISVGLMGTSRGTVTDNNGFYSITRIDPGNYTLFVSALGYDTVMQAVKVAANEILTQNVSLTPIGVEMGQVTVRDKRGQKKTRVEMSKVEISARQIEIIPSIGGEPDIAQYLQLIPGVVFTGDQGGQLYIRGGAPIQNKVILDGMTVYNPFHSIGLFSVFDVDVIQNVDVYTGGFNAMYGGRVSAIMDVTTRDGNKGRFGGKVSASPFTSKLTLEGPIKKFSQEAGGSSFLFTTRTSYLRQTAPLLYPYANREQGLPYNFTDAYGKVSFMASGGTRASIFGFNFNDDVNFKGVTHYKWNSAGAGTKLFFVPSGSSTIIETNFAYSNYSTSLTEKDGKPRSSQIGGFDAGVDFTYYPYDDQLKYGIDILGFRTNFEFFNAAGRRLYQEEFTTELGGYVRYNRVMDRLILDPSLRLHYYASLSEFSPEPRIAVKYLLTEKIRLKGAAGLYSQNLISAQSDQDVVNLFYGFLSGPDNIPEKFDGREVTSHLQKARHLIGGVELDLAKDIEFQVEPYLKYFNQLTNINRNKIFDDNDEFRSKPERLKSDYIIETGKAYGVDFLVTYDHKPFYFWAAYSLSKVTRYDGEQTYYPHWDRRHNTNLLISYEFGKEQSYQLSVRWAYGSGFPFTGTQGFYELIDFQQNGINTDYTQENGSLGILLGPYNNKRLADFHRLDASLKKTVKLKGDTKLGIVLSVTNIYNRNNVFYFDRLRYQPTYQLPILPSIAANLSF